MRSGWQRKPLGDLCEIRTGRKDVNQGNPQGAYPFFTCARTHTFSDEYSFDAEALLIAGNGDVGTVTYYQGKFEAYQRTYVLLAFKNVLPRFLFLALEGTLKATVAAQKLGNTMPYIKKGMLTDFEVPLPPLLEQRRIIAILDEAFEGIAAAVANAEKNLANARELLESYLYSVFTQKGEGWVENKLGDLCHGVEYGTASKSSPDGAIPVLRMGNLQNGTIVWDDLVYTSGKKEINKYMLEPGDVLFNRTNSAEHVGKAAVYQGERPAIFAGYLIRIHRDKSRLEADYLNYYLNSSLAREHGRRVMSRSVNQANINGTKLKEYRIRLPSLRVQQDISQALNSLSSATRRLESCYCRKLTTLDRLKQSLLRKAFAGELTSEPAQTLKEALA